MECVDARAADGRTQLALGNESAALADQKEILASVEKMHSTLAASDLLKQNFQPLWEEAYSITIDLHFRRGEFREALEASELARSRAFIDLLASRALGRPAAVNSSIGSASTAGDARLPGNAARAPLRGASTQPSRQLQSTPATLRSDASAAAPTIEGLTATAARLHSTLLAYWVGANNVYMWSLSPDGTVRGASVGIARAKLDELIRSITPFTAAARDTSSGWDDRDARRTADRRIGEKSARVARALRRAHRPDRARVAARHRG